MKLNEQANTVKRAIAIAGIAIAATTGCSKNEKKETSQKDEHVEMVKKTRESVKEKDYDTIPGGGGILEGKPMTLPRPLVEKARAEGKLNLPRQVNDIGPLAGVPIEEIDMSWTGYASRLKDLSPLKGAPLKKLNISYSLVDDIEVLRGMPLEEIDISSTGVRDLSPLKGSKLRVLSMSNTAIKDFSPIHGMPIEVFEVGTPLHGSELRAWDLAPLKDCPLKEVDLTNLFQLRDISFLKGKPLESLSLRSTEVSDISVLKGMPLRSLNLKGTQVRDISALRGMKLTDLSLVLTGVTDLSPLAGMPLERLELGQAATDLRPIKDILDRLRKKERGFHFFSSSRDIDWNTYQIVEKEGGSMYPR